MTHCRWTAAAVTAATVIAALAGCSPAAPTADDFAAVPSALQGGSPDPATRAVVGLIAHRPEGGQICSGVLLSQNVVLTVRHCVASSFPDTVRCGQATIGPPVPVSAIELTTKLTTDNSLPDDGGARHAVAAIELVPGGDDACGFDLAALVLGDVVAPSEAAPLVPRFDPPITAGEGYSALGFGATCPVSSREERCYLESGTRRRVDGLHVMCADGCPLAAIASTEWQGDRALCEGDSGGPALDALGQVIGVGVRGSSDDAGNCVDGVYVSVASWKSFLVDVVQRAAVAAKVAPPDWAPLPRNDASAPTDGSLDSEAARDSEAPASDVIESPDGDAAGTEAEGIEGAGCSCTTTRARSALPLAWWGWAVAVAALRSRRRRAA